VIILRDTREKQPWDFEWYNEVKKVEVCTVKVGDYTLKGYEDLVAIERKRSTGELAINFGKKRKQFLAEMEKMRDYKWRYVICEFPRVHLLRFPEDSGIPKRDWKYLRMNAGYINKTVNDLTEKYGVTFLFCQSPYEAQDEAIKIFQTVIDDDGKDEDYYRPV
jgi:hypothetical protein